MGSKAILLSLSSIGILIFGLSSCPTMSEAQADELNDSVATHPSFVVQPVISLALQPTVDVDLVPQSNGSFGATTAKLSVSTNSAEGYSLYMSTADGSPNLKTLTSPNLHLSDLPPPESTNKTLLPTRGAIALIH